MKIYSKKRKKYDKNEMYNSKRLIKNTVERRTTKKIPRQD